MESNAGLMCLRYTNSDTIKGRKSKNKIKRIAHRNEHIPYHEMLFGEKFRTVTECVLTLRMRLIYRIFKR